MFVKPNDRGADPNIVHNLVHSGFDFPPPSAGDICRQAPSIQIVRFGNLISSHDKIGTGLSLSPNGTALVKSLPDGDVKVVPMEYVGGSLDPKENMGIFVPLIYFFYHCSIY